MLGLSDYEKQCMRNDFDGTPNEQSVVLSASPFQFRMALIHKGILPTQIDQAIYTLIEPERSKALVWWEYAPEYSRNSPVLTDLAPTLGLTCQDLDELFVLAVSI